jgi:hypothetical protein
MLAYLQLQTLQVSPNHPLHPTLPPEGRTKLQTHGSQGCGFFFNEDATQCQRSRTIKKLTHTVWAYKRSDVIDWLELLGSSRAVIQRVYDSL